MKFWMHKNENANSYLSMPTIVSHKGSADTNSIIYIKTVKTLNRNTRDVKVTEFLKHFIYCTKRKIKKKCKTQGQRTCVSFSIKDLLCTLLQF